MIACIQKEHPDININNIRRKRNTGNGGFYIDPQDKDYGEIIITPMVESDKIVCEFWLRTEVKRSKNLLGKSWEEMMAVPEVAKMINIMDECVVPLLKNALYFEGDTHPRDMGLTTYFKSFGAEQEYRKSLGWDKEWICDNVNYYINLASESLFSDQAIVKTIADLVVALYKYRMAAREIDNDY